jgi:hypothetical protein
LCHDFEVVVEPGGPQELTQGYLAGFEPVDGVAPSSYVMHVNPDATITLTFGDEVVGDAVFPWRAVSLLGWHVNNTVVDLSAGTYTLLHAAAAAREGLAVILAAPMEHGKTTTVTGLIRAGFAYLTDEAVAINADSLTIEAFHKPLTLDKGSWPLFPELRPRSDADLGSSWWVQASAIRADAAIARAHAGLIVFPTYRAGSVTELRPIGQTSAVIRLAESTFAFTVHAPRNLATLARLVRSAPAYELAIGNLDEAVSLISRLVDEMTVAA